MGGHLDEWYPSVLGSRNGWLGGDGDVWERGPYWLDGLLPLAYQLNDKKLQQKLQKWVEWSIAEPGQIVVILVLFLPQKNLLQSRVYKETGPVTGGQKW